MAIGYANFGTIQQGNQQVINSMAGLGQSISSAIETHAATQSAQAMLPMLQQQYQAGIGKISNGDQGGMGDIIQAATLASQNPLTADIGKNMIAGMQQVSHMARTQAFLQGRGMATMAAHPEMFNQDGSLNTAKLGQAAQGKPPTVYQQAEIEKMNRQAQINQINSYNSLYSGTKDSEGIGALAEKIRTAVDGGKTPEETDVRSFASKVSAYKQVQGAYGNQAIKSPEIEAAYQEVQSQIPALQGLMKAEQAKGEGFLGMQFLGGTSPEKVGKMKASVKQLQGIGGMPSAKGAQGGGVDHAALYQQAQDAIKRGKDPTAVMKRMKELGFDPDAYRSQMQGATQGAPQASIDTSGGQQIAGNSPEYADEAEAVGGEEETSPDGESMVA